ncbi:DUF58 domain-containing protein [Virgibacillus sp. FSP13]
MMWQKEFGSTNSKNNDYLLAAIVVLIAISFFFKKPVLFLLVGLFTAFLVLNKWYGKKIGEKLELNNKRQVIRLFPGDETKMTFEFQNRSIFPIVNGEFQFQTEPAIQATKYVEATSKYWNQFHMPLSVIGKGKVTITLPIQAEKRGTSRVKNIQYRFPHLFNFDTVTLKYNPFFYMEYVVFPKPLPVNGLELLSYVTPGSQQTNFSPFEDVQSPRGTRAYSYSDPFHRINWKASAKTQELQTNVYDRVVDMSYVFIVNIGIKHGRNTGQLNKDLEKLLAYTAYLCQYATEKGIPYQIAINARKPGKTPYVVMPEGEGKTHYVQALEMLARIHPQAMVVPFTQMLFRVGQNFSKSKTIIIIGELPFEANQIINKWRQKHIFHVESAEDGAFINQWAKDGFDHAK